MGDDVPICYSPDRPEDVAIQTNDGDACSPEPFWVIGTYNLLALKLFAILGLTYIAMYNEQTVMLTAALVALAPITYSLVLVLSSDASLALWGAVPVTMLILMTLAIFLF